MKNFLNNKDYFRKKIQELVDKPESSFIDEDKLKFFQDKGNQEQALIKYRRILQENSDDLEALVNTGCILFLQEKEDAAEEFFQKAKELDPQNYLINFNIANLYYEKKRFEKAILY